MDRAEASLILRKYLDELESLGYSELSTRVGHDEALERTAPSGLAYQLEVSILWDHQPGGPVRIIGSIDDGGLSAFIPLSEGRLIRPQPKPSSP